MTNQLSDHSVHMIRQERNKKLWHRVVSVMASIVVFCTTYALILPAITMTEDYYCGKEEHIHTEECYQIGPIKTCICTATPHQHTDACYDGNGNLQCGLADFFVHTHSEICYDHNQKQICQLPEHTMHTHTEDCYLGGVYSCGMKDGEGHVHRDTCYTTKSVFTCELPEQDAHQHGEACYTQNSILTCGMEEHDSHWHTDACYVTQSVLTCTIPEHPAHQHEDACYSIVETLSCTLPENAEHTHEAACYTQQSVLACGIEETEGHSHDSAACYSEEQKLQCKLSETEGHLHSDSCYGQEQTLICELKEGDGHLHTTETCYTEKQTLHCVILEGTPHHHDETCQLLSAPVLVCNKLELKMDAHGPECNDELGNRICGKWTVAEHIHTEECFHIEELEEPRLICEQEEHEHTLICTSDSSADLETAEVWRSSIPAGESLTGTPAENLLAVARSQLGYQESTRNFTLSEAEERKGYTRYGQWYGDPYGDWCAMYVSFCLHYSGFPQEAFPYESGCQRWVEKLTDLEVYHNEAEYTPVPGDVVFFGKPDRGSTHVGIVVEVTEAEIKTIEGNTSDCVAYNTYSRPNGEGYILGYASIDAVHRRGVELGVFSPIPEEPEVSEAVMLETLCSGWKLMLEAPSEALPAEADKLQLVVQEEMEESILTEVCQILGEEAEFLVVNLQVLLEDEDIQPSTPVMLKILPEKETHSIEEVLILTNGEKPELHAQEKHLAEDGTVTVELAELSSLVLQYRQAQEPSEEEPQSISLEAEWEDWRILLDAPADAFAAEAESMQLQIQTPGEAALTAAREALGAEASFTALQIQVVSNEEPMQPAVPVHLQLHCTAQAFTAEDTVTLYRIADSETAALETVEAAIHPDGYLALDVVELSSLVIVQDIPEAVEEEICLETQYEDFTIRLTAPKTAFAAETENLLLSANPLSEETLSEVQTQFADEAIHAAFQLQVLLGEESVQPAVPVQLTVIREALPYHPNDTIRGYSIPAGETELQEMSVQVNTEGAAVSEITELAAYVLFYTEAEKEPVMLEAETENASVRLSALESAFEQDIADLTLTVTELDKESARAVSDALDKEKAYVGLHIQLLNGETPVQPVAPVQLAITLKSDTTEDPLTLELYRIQSEEPFELVQMEFQQEEKTLTAEVDALGKYAIAYPKPFNGVVLETEHNGLQITLQAPYEAFVSAPGALTLVASEMDSDILDQACNKISAFKSTVGLDLQILAADKPVAPEVPVELIISDRASVFEESEDITIYQATDGGLNITELSSTHDGENLRLMTSQLAGIVIVYEGTFDGIQLEAEYGEIHVRLRAPYDAFPVTAENLTLVVTEPEESIKASIAENMEEDKKYFAVDIQILCDGQPIQPNGDVQVIFEMKDDPFPNAESVSVYHVRQDAEKQALDVQQVEGGLNSSRDVVMQTNHFSTYVVMEPESPVTYAVRATPSNRWEDALMDRSGNIGVESEGYTDSPYTNTREFASENITSVGGNGGTAYLGKYIWPSFYRKPYYSERYWDGGAPVRITSTDPERPATLTKTVYADWILEDDDAPKAPLKIDNVNLETNFAGMNIYGRGNKIVIGENVTTESGELFRIYGGSFANDRTTGYPTNVVVESGYWHLVCGGGHSDIPNGTTVTIRDTASVGTLYGGGTQDSTVGTPNGANTDVNIFIEGGYINQLYGGNRVESTNCAIYEDINIEITGGHVDVLYAGNDYSHSEDSKNWQNSYVQGNVTVAIRNGGSATTVIGDPIHNAFGSRSIKGATILEAYCNEQFNRLDQWDVVRIIGTGSPNSTTVETAGTTGIAYIGRIEVTDGGRLYLKENGYINVWNEPDQILTPQNSGSQPYDLKHAWQGESSEARRSFSTLAIEGSAITPSGSYSFDEEEGKAGLRIKGNVEGYSVLEACGTPMYSNGKDYYYYVVADSSNNGGKAFREPEGAPYVVCYRYLEDGRIGWYLRERPVLSFDNKLVRVGTDGSIVYNEDGSVKEFPHHYMVMHVEMNGFAYEWSSNSEKNRVDFTWTAYDGVANATPAIGGVSIQTMADIANNINSKSNPGGYFTNVVYGTTGTDEGSVVEQNRVTSFDIIIDPSTAADPRYYSVSANYHYIRGDESYDDLHLGQTVDAARCTYDFAKTGEPMGDGGYTDSVMTTYKYDDDVPPIGADNALMRLYLPEFVSAANFTVTENDNNFKFEKSDTPEASLTTDSEVNKNYKTNEKEIYDKKFAVMLQPEGGTQDELVDDMSISNVSGAKKFYCWVSSHEKLSYTDITKESSEGLQLHLKLTGLTKDGKAVGTGDPAAVNNGELRIQTVPIDSENVMETTTLIVEKVVTGLAEGATDSSVFEFSISYQKTVEGKTVPHEESFELQHGGAQDILVPLGVEITVQETNHDGYYAQVKDQNDQMIYSDTVTVTIPESIPDGSEELKVTFYNSPGDELPESGSIGTQLYTFLGLLLTLGAIALFWMHRRERRAVS